MLEVSDLHAYYGKSHVLHGVGFAIRSGEIVSLLGRNGVGRSTTVKAIMGQVTATGSVKFKGQEILGLRAFEIARLRDRLRTRGSRHLPRPDGSPEPGHGDEEAEGERPLAHRSTCSTCSRCSSARADTPAGVLSGGEQQMLTLCRTLIGDPDLIMIDEPTEGLAPKIVEQVGAFLSTIKRRGISVLLVEQKLAIALDISERVYVVGHGRIVFEGSPAGPARRTRRCGRSGWRCSLTPRAASRGAARGGRRAREASQPSLPGWDRRSRTVDATC